MKKHVKNLAAAAMAVVMVMGMAIFSGAENIAVYSTCGHSTQTTSIEGPYQTTYKGQHLVEGKTCTITRRVGIRRQRCTLCGAILSETAYEIPTDIHSISH